MQQMGFKTARLDGEDVVNTQDTTQDGACMCVCVCVLLVAEQRYPLIFSNDKDAQ